MKAPRVTVDFVGRRAALTPAGALLLLLAAGAAGGVFLEYRSIETRRAALEIKLDAAMRRAERTPSDDAHAAGMMAEAGRIASELGAPWTGLLAELELASHDSAENVALLSVEPDSGKHRVHITAESRDLPTALAYLKRLQASRLLRFPMLDSHDVRPDVPERPVLFALTADWVVTP